MTIVNYEIHKTHAPLWQKDDWRYAILMGGRGNGRSGTASRFVISQLLGKEYTRGAIMRATREDIRASCWGEIMDRVNEQKLNESFRITDNDMFIERGRNSVRANGFRASSGSLTARLKSLAGYNFIWIEEAEEIGEEEFRILDDTLRTVLGRIRIVFTLNTPAKNHWILRKWFDMEASTVQGFYIPHLKTDAKDVIYIGGSWKENEINLDKHTIERYKAYQYLNPSYYWQVIEGLSPEEVRGKIYSGWSQIEAIPDGARLIKFGLDWGWYPDPVSVIALYYWNGNYIVDEIIHGTNIEDALVADSIKKVNGWGDVPVICGADEPKSIEMLQKYRIRSVATDNRSGSVDYRIKITSTKKILVTKRSTNVWISYENYAWAEDKDGKPKGVPSHHLSDAMDAVSYAVAENDLGIVMTSEEIEDQFIIGANRMKLNESK
jgi:phage terminase large subunit